MHQKKNATDCNVNNTSRKEEIAAPNLIAPNKPKAYVAGTEKALN